MARINQATSLPRDSVCVQGVAWLEIDTMDGQVHRVEVAGDDCPMMAMGGQAFDLRTPQEMALARTQAGGGPYITDLVYAPFDRVQTARQALLDNMQ